jgi:hypothetical protein
MKYYLSIGSLLLSFLLHAQFSSDHWHEGILVTSGQDTLYGEIKYNLETNMVQVSIRNNVSAYSSYNILYFEIFDQVYQSYREFYTLPYKYKGNYESPIIFELLYEGGLSLLSREKIEQEPVSTGFTYGPRIMQPKLNYDFYFLDTKGRMTYFGGVKNDLLNILGDKRIQIKNYIKKNRLKTDEIGDLVRITSFYNSI